MLEKRYNNYHKHTHYSNKYTTDSICKPEDYMKRAVELGHTTYFTTEHGYFGNIYEAQTLCEKYKLKPIYAVEAYYTDDISVEEKDRRSYHIMLIGMTEKARYEINKIISIANTDGFYYKPRIGLKELLSLTPEETIITTACIASRMFRPEKLEKTDTILRYRRHLYESDGEQSPIPLGYLSEDSEDYNKYPKFNAKNPASIFYKDEPVYEEVPINPDYWYDNFFIPIKNYFKDNLYLEVQSHNTNSQKQYNKKILKLAGKTNTKIIHANDSHYILPSEAKYRDLFLKAKGISYEEEENFILDYPSYDTILERYKKQGVLSKEEAIEALDNTLIFDNAEAVYTDKEFKIPLVPNDLIQKKLGSNFSNLDNDAVLREIVGREFKKRNDSNKIKPSLKQKYIDAILDEINTVRECGMASYFVLDYMVAERSVDVYNAVMTKSGRGSAVSFIINNFLRLTEVDRIKAPIKLYPSRFMSAERILNSRSIPDIDLNWADTKPVVRATKDILGEDGIYYMVAYKPLQRSSAFRLWCKGIGKNIKEYDEIAKNLAEKTFTDEMFCEKYPLWADILEDSKIFRGVIESVAPSPCSYLLSNEPISEKVGLIKVGDEICCALDGYNCDVYKFLKNDYLIVSVYDIISKTYEMIGRPIDDISTLVNNCDEKVWDIYAKGLTTTINQVDSDLGKTLIMRYKPKNLAELAAWVAAIRPGFSSLLNNFLDRKDYTTGVKELDNILEDSYHYMLYQESIMAFLTWLGIEEKSTYDIIKKISKKKFTAEALSDLKEKLLKGWIKNTGSDKGFENNWQVVQDAASYSFNASHALSVAIDSLYGAYLKSHYPLEYFTCVLNSYNYDIDRTANLTSELEYFNIELKPLEFRKSGSSYKFDKENNTIYKSIKSVKYMNESIGDFLYSVKDKKYDDFLDFIKDFSGKGNARQLKILIYLDFFKEFGKTKYLVDIYDTYIQYFGNIELKKEKCVIPMDIIEKYCTKETAKKYRFENGIGIDMIRDICKYIPNASYPLGFLLEQQKENLGYIAFKDKNIDPKYRICIEFKTYTNKNKPYISLYKPNDGTVLKTKIINEDLFEQNMFKIYSILYVNSFTKRKKSKKIDDKWIKTNEDELVLSDYNVMKL